MRDRDRALQGWADGERLAALLADTPRWRLLRRARLRSQRHQVLDRAIFYAMRATGQTSDPEARS